MPRGPRVQPPRKPNPLTKLNLQPPAPSPYARQALAGAVKKARRLCPNKTCQEPKIEDGICTNCGTIIDESNIVSEITFGESASGAAVVQGSFVSADQGAARSMGPAFQRAGGGEPDREKTLREGKRFMNGLAGEHHIPESTVNTGMQIFKLAAMNNFIQGRRINHVAAVCLYTAARKSKPCRVMLIDFADSCQMNVFRLGRCFKMLHEKVTMSSDGMDPVIPEDLIYRFASRLEFNEDTLKVAETAVRLVQRMSIDWMVMGRRPSGICGACLIMAARIHNYRRTVKEVVYIVKVTTATIQKRMEEFKQTASSELTVEEFLGNEFLEQAHDPPSFYQKTDAYLANKKTRKRKRIRNDDDEEDLDSEMQSTTDGISRLGSVVSEAAEPEIQRDADGFVIPAPPAPKEIQIDPALLEDTENQAALESLVREHGDIVPETEQTEEEITVAKSIAQVIVDEEWQAEEEEIEAEINEEITEMMNDPHTVEHAKAFASAEQRARVTSMIANIQNPSKGIPMTANIEDTEFSNDPEVLHCLLSPEESAIKEKIWLNANDDWLRDQQRKLYMKKIADKTPKITRKRNKKPRIGEGQLTAASSPAEAAVAVMKNRTWSKRINYDAIAGIFDGPLSGPGSTATSRVTSAAGSTVGASVAGSEAASNAQGSEVGNALLSDLEDDEDEDVGFDPDDDEL